jgi:hypothetical protein
VYFSSIYDFKAVLAADVATGKISWTANTRLSPKSDLLFSGKKLVALTSDGGLGEEKREIPGEVVVIDPRSGRIYFTKELRGSNFFPQLLKNNEAFLALSTGDIVTVGLDDGKVTVVDQFPEPFLASTFHHDGNSCAASTMGRVVCYDKNKKLVNQKELSENIIGWVEKPLDGKIFLPTRKGYKVWP